MLKIYNSRMENASLAPVRGLNQNQLKLIAVAAMTVDHIAWAFIPTAYPLAQIFHVFGRLTAPIMCFCIAEGYAHTRSAARYLATLFAFAVLSHVPFVWFELGTVRYLLMNTGVVYTLFLSLLALVVWKSKLADALKYLLLAAIIAAATLGDWGWCAVLWTLGFHRFRDDTTKRNLWFSAVCVVEAVYLITKSVGMGYSWTSNLFQFATLLALPLISLYNGQRGALRLKWFFYLYYPVHLAIIAAVRSLLWYGEIRF